ncbi:hypothetical protein BGZ65_006188, partial [Modicella reniformis]
IQLSGPLAGTKYGMQKIIIPDAVFDHPDGKSSFPAPDGSSGGGDGLSGTPNDSLRQTIIIGTVSAIAVLFVCIFGCVWFKKRAARLRVTVQTTTVQCPAPVITNTTAAAVAAEVQQQQRQEPPLEESEMKLEDTTFNCHAQQQQQQQQQQHQQQQPLVESEMKLEDTTFNYHGQQQQQQQSYHIPGTLPSYQSPPVTFMGTPALQQQQLDMQFSIHPRPNVVTTGPNEDLRTTQSYMSPPATFVSPSSAPQALPATMVRLPGPQTEHYNDTDSPARAIYQIPAVPPMQSTPAMTYVGPPSPRTGPSAPQFRG